MPPKGAAVCLPLLALSIASAAGLVGRGGDEPAAAAGTARYYVHREGPRSPPYGPNRRSGGLDEAHYNQQQQQRPFSATRRHDTGFDPDVLNRFLEEYASKMKLGRPSAAAYEEDPRPDGQELGEQYGEPDARNSTNRDETPLNDTIKRHKFYSGNSHDERNSGWVTLDAIPWSKSKISKWQANPTTQGPWPDAKPWDKPAYNKPWDSDYPSRPASYESGKPWQNQVTKPHWADNSPSASNKPWYSQDRPRPGPQQEQNRPSYPPIDKYEDNPNQAEKWPPERPSWDRYGDSHRPQPDIITDNGPPNFPSSSWDRPGQRPTYVHHTESYASDPHGGWHDRNDFPGGGGSGGPSKFPGRPAVAAPDDGYYDRPHFSHYQYPSSGGEHPSNHPSSGDGQWVLLSSNRGYSKSRQRSIKLEADAAKGGSKSRREDEERAPAVTSKRQVRLTVLPAINSSNTATSHGGLLEVERTFMTVDQSQREYELRMNVSRASRLKATSASPSASRPTRPTRRPTANAIVLGGRPLENAAVIAAGGGDGAPSSSAILAAVGAGMLPATMAMMIPMVFGRRRRKRLARTEECLDYACSRMPAVSAGRMLR